MSPALRHAHSSPNLHSKPMLSTEDAAGNHVRLCIHPEASTGLPSFHTSANVLKTFEPFTMAPVMVVRIDEERYNLHGAFALKVFDRRYSDDLRQHVKMRPWTETSDCEFRKFMLTPDGEKLHRECDAYLVCDLPEYAEDNNNDSEEPSDDDWKAREEEGWIYTQSQKMYRNEVTVYRRMHDYQGTGNPRLIATVSMSKSNSSSHLQPDHTDIATTPAILLQYLPGFPLSDLYNHPTSRNVPREEWQHLIDSTLVTINTMGKRGILNTDTSTRNTVVNLDSIEGVWKAKIIDFGHCQFRDAGTSTRDWRDKRSRYDEEDEIGGDVRCSLGKKKGGGYVYVRSMGRNWIGILRWSEGRYEWVIS